MAALPILWDATMRCVWRGGPHDGQPIEIPDHKAEADQGVMIAIERSVSTMLSAEPDDRMHIEKVFVPIVRTKTRNYLDWTKRRPA